MEKADNGKDLSGLKYVLAHNAPSDSGSCHLGPQSPTYAKATCTSVPGKVICTLGRYTFVINHGEHEMDPEVIERFAAMVYHRTQEGDSNFDVAVESITSTESWCMGEEEDRGVVGSEPFPRSLKQPIYVECTPLRDERRLCRPNYVPSEVIYACRRHHLGIGKRAIISVGPRGRVSDGLHYLPYPELLLGKRSLSLEQDEVWDEKIRHLAIAEHSNQASQTSQPIVNNPIKLSNNVTNLTAEENRGNPTAFVNPTVALLTENVTKSHRTPELEKLEFPDAIGPLGETISGAKMSTQPLEKNGKIQLSTDTHLADSQQMANNHIAISKTSNNSTQSKAVSSVTDLIASNNTMIRKELSKMKESQMRVGVNNEEIVPNNIKLMRSILRKSPDYIFPNVY